MATESPVPVIFGVLTTETIEQAVERAGTKAATRASTRRMAALEMMSLYRSAAGRQADDRHGHSRRRGREFALQMLYQLDVQDAAAQSADQAMRCSAATSSAERRRELQRRRLSDAEIEAARPFAEKLVRGVRQHLAELDAQIQRASKNWRLERMARVDRNLLRLALYELSTPTTCRRRWRSTRPSRSPSASAPHESPAFVNGILDRCREELGRK